jgi:hypothetical protein
MKYLLTFTLITVMASAFEYRKKIINLPTATSITKALQKDIYLHDFCKNSFIAKQLDNKKMTYPELDAAVHKSITQWADHHKNIMIALCAEPTAQLVVKTIFSSQPQVCQEYEHYVNYKKEIKEVQSYLV